jgi:hypothetical protein
MMVFPGRATLLSLVLFLAAGSSVQAGLIPVSLSPVAQLDGTYRWTYQITLPSQTQIKTGDYFTIYDFAGYVPGSNGQPATDWSFSANLLGITPPGVLPTDNPNIWNLTWQYTGVDSTIGQIGLGNFWASSLYSTSGNSNFTAHTHKLVQNGGSANSNISTTVVPVPTATPEVPEPATLVLAGLGLPLIGVARMMRRRMAQQA